MCFFGSKIFTTGFFAIITFNLSKAFRCFSGLRNSTFHFFLNLHTALSVRIFCYISPIEIHQSQKDPSSFLFVGVAIFSIFSINACFSDIPSFEMV